VEQSLWMALVGLVGGIVATMAVVWGRSKRAGAETAAAKNSASRIIEEAKKDAAAVKKEAELQAKDSVLKERAEFEREVRDTRR
jgi:ribonucrease Y